MDDGGHNNESRIRRFHTKFLDVKNYWLVNKIFSTKKTILVSILSLFGIFQTALIVGVLSEALIIPPEEKRILASLEKQRLEKIRRDAAASLIQWAWRVYAFGKGQAIGIYDNENNMTFANMKRKLGRKYNQIMDGGQITVKYAYALWQWRQVKQQTENVDQG